MTAAMERVQMDEVVIEVAQFMVDPSIEVRKAAVEALLWDGDHRWNWIRFTIRRVMADPLFMNDGPLLPDVEGQRIECQLFEAGGRHFQAVSCGRQIAKEKIALRRTGELAGLPRADISQHQFSSRKRGALAVEDGSVHRAGGLRQRHEGADGQEKAGASNRLSEQSVTSLHV